MSAITDTLAIKIRDLAETQGVSEVRLRKAAGLSKRQFGARMEDPGTFYLEELRAIGELLGRGIVDLVTPPSLLEGKIGARRG